MSVLFLTLVHPDFLPPVYAASQVLLQEGYDVDVYTFESSAPDTFSVGDHVNINIVGAYKGNGWERYLSRRKYHNTVKEYIKTQKPTAVFCFCEFTYLTALKISKTVPVFYFALELFDFSITDIFRSPLSTLRKSQAACYLPEARYLCTPSSERSGWMAGRYKLKQVPDTVHNAPYIAEDYSIQGKKDSHLLPEQFKRKIKILHTGGVTDTRSVKELIFGFEKLNLEDTCLVITNVGNSEYASDLKAIVKQSKRSSDILLLNTISRTDLLNLQQSCDIGICLMKLEHGFDSRMIAPNKVGEYLYSGLLVLGMNTPYFNQFQAYEVIETIDDLRSDTIANALSSLYDKVKSNQSVSGISRCLKDWYNMKYQMRNAVKELKKI